jgi:hypothetical protein
MKSFLFFLLLIFTLQLRAQPQLSPVFQLPELPDLTISQLLQYQDLLTFKHKEGIVIYNRKEDQWTLFKCLDQYEELGRIVEINKINERLIVSLERGGAVVSGSKVKTFNSTILASFEIKNKLLILSGEIHPYESSNPYFYDLYYSNADRLLLYDPEKDETETIKLPKPIYSVKSYELFKDHLWIYAFDEESEYWFSELLKVDLKGNVTSIEPPGTNFNLIRSLKAFEDHLFILRDSSLVSYSDNNSMRKIMEINPIKWHGIVRSYETGFYIFRSRSRDGSNDIIGYTQIDLSTKTSNDISVPVSYTTREKIYTDCRIFHAKLFKYCDDFQQVQSLEMSEPAIFKDYNIRDGITNRIKNLTEDEKETWFVGSFSGIHRYIKSDSTWVNYPQFNNYQDDSAGILRMEVFTINKDYVFIPLISDTRGIVKYLLFDRQHEEFMVMNREEFIRKFLFDGERFVSYTGEELTKHPPNIMNHIIDYQGDVWNLFLFLYELPISGNSGSDHSNLIISNGRCTILSFHMMHPKMWYDGILLKLKNDSTIYFTLAPKSIQDFDHASHPFFIGGDAYRVFAGSPGNNAHGLLIYDPSTYTCKTDKIFYQTLSDFSFLQGTGQYVMVGCYGNGKWGKLYSIDVLTNELTDLSMHISATPRNCKSTQNYIYVATDEGLVYFDHDLNFLGKLFSDQCKLSRTKLNLYLISADKVFLIEE